MEHSDDHIDVTLVLPGPVFTDLFRAAFTEEPDRVQRNSDLVIHFSRTSSYRCVLLEWSFCFEKLL